MLKVASVDLERGGRRVLQGVDIAVTPGEFLTLVGPNGAGKSTLLALLSGRLTPDTGAVSLDGIGLALWDHPTLARRRAVLSQHVQLAFGFTALEVVLIGRCPHLRRSERPVDLRVAHETLAAVDASHLAQRSYLELSGGEQQRVQLARVLAQVWQAGAAPRYLLLDEPDSGQDIAHRHLVLDLCRRLASGGVGVVAVLHDLNLAAAYASRVAVLDAGRLVADAPPEAALKPALLSRVYGFALHRRTLADDPTRWVIAH